MSNAIRLADWLKFHAAGVDHLRLQKLSFYCFGAAIAHGHEREIGDIRFQAWKHGPVNVEVYHAHCLYGRDVLPRPLSVQPYSAGLEQVLNDVIAVYGRLSSWQLREESHDEAPWIDTDQSAEISPEAIRQHFNKKFATNSVEAPRQLVRAWSFDADRIPLQRWPNLRTLAAALSA